MKPCEIHFSIQVATQIKDTLLKFWGKHYTVDQYHKILKGR